MEVINFGSSPILLAEQNFGAKIMEQPKPKSTESVEKNALSRLFSTIPALDVTRSASQKITQNTVRTTIHAEEYQCK